MPGSAVSALLCMATTADPRNLHRPSNIGRSGSVSGWGHCSFLLGLGAHRSFVCALEEWISVSLSLVILSSNPAGLQGQVSWGFPVPFLDPQAGKPDVRLQNLHNSGRTSLVSLFFSL